MPEQYLYLNRGSNPIAGPISLNEGDEVDLEKRDDGSYNLNIKGAVVTGDVHEVSIGPGAAGGVAKVWPPMTEAHAVIDTAETEGFGPAAKPAASTRKGASAAEKKAAAGDAQPADENEDGTPASKTAGETPPESGGKAGTGFSGQVAP